jgi:hypothetical protein
VGRSKLLLALLALAISISLFLFVRGERRVSLSYSVPCDVLLPAGLAPATPLPAEVTVSVSGPWSRLRSLDPESFGPVRIDFSRARAGSASWAVRPEVLHAPRDVRVDAVYPAQGVVELRPIPPPALPLQPRGAWRAGLRRRPRVPESER